jgi:hypothetical protein
MQVLTGNGQHTSPLISSLIWTSLPCHGHKPLMAASNFSLCIPQSSWGLKDITYSSSVSYIMKVSPTLCPPLNIWLPGKLILRVGIEWRARRIGWAKETGKLEGFPIPSEMHFSENDRYFFLLTNFKKCITKSNLSNLQVICHCDSSAHLTSFSNTLELAMALVFSIFYFFSYLQYMIQNCV